LVGFLTDTLRLKKIKKEGNILSRRRCSTGKQRAFFSSLFITIGLAWLHSALSLRILHFIIILTSLTNHLTYYLLYRPLPANFPISLVGFLFYFYFFLIQI